jgi:DNA-binding GntR family transcriptional regulator
MEPQAAMKTIDKDKNLDKKAGEPKQPLYRQLVQAIKNDILAGVYPVGTQLPTEEELTTRFSVSRHTVRQALRQLRDDGLVASRQGAGTTVLPLGGGGDSYVHEVGSIADIIAFATEIRYQVDSMEMVVSDDQLAQRIGCAVGERWLRIQGYRFSGEQKLPVCWTEAFVGADYAGVSRLIKRHPGPIFELIEDLYGERIAEVEQTIQGGLVPPDIAPKFEIEPKATVFEVQRVYRLADGKIVEAAFSLYPVDRFRSSMTLRRVKS